PLRDRRRAALSRLWTRVPLAHARWHRRPGRSSSRVAHGRGGIPQRRAAGANLLQEASRDRPGGPRAGMIHHAVRAAIGCTLAICSHAAAQTTYLAVREAIADSHATLPGGALLNIPVTGNDFVLTADGQLVERGNGTAHLSAVLRRASAFDRWLVLELELSGFVPAHSPLAPPAGALPNTLTASSYA